MKNLEDLFKHELKDLYSAETQLLEAFPRLQKNATDEKLKKAFDEHLKETQQHKKRIEEVCEELNMDPKGEKCKAMEGLIKELDHFLEQDTEKDVKDAGLVAEAQRIEHYEISGYGTTIRYAKELGYKEIASKLHKTLEEEFSADEKLTKIAEGRLNKKAKS